MRKRIYFDVDGVLNRHKPFRNRYCGIEPACLSQLCRILRSVPDADLVISSAWRYVVANGDMTCRGFEYMLMIHGAPYDLMHDRIAGITETEEAVGVELGLLEAGATFDYEWLKENGCQLRAVQIERNASRDGVDRYAVLDDLDLEMPDLFITDGEVGLTREIADMVIGHLL